MSHYIFKIADTKDEFEQIHRLNYETFVEEIPQHGRNSSSVLVDKFHSENTYIICKMEDRVLGMITVRDKRPFSLDQKLGDLEKYITVKPGKICEIRLLSIKKSSRFGRILSGLFRELASYCETRKYEIALISATTTQLKLYRTLGFKAFGPLVGTGDAMFQPMYLTLDSYMDFKARSTIFKRNKNIELKREVKPFRIFLPGPVDVKEEVRMEFERSPVSHRSAKFVSDFNRTRTLLGSKFNTEHAEILMGSGTLANDAVAAQLSLLGGKGLVLSNGEFGDRLEDHARRFGLDYDRIREEWGNVFPEEKLRDYITGGNYSWVWMVHCETSTGILNDLDYVRNLCERNSAALCLDCISSVGVIPLDLSGIYLASGVSGKGMGSYPGLCFVLYNHNIEPVADLPRYIDLGMFRAAEGIPFTISSNLLYALKKSLELFESDTLYDSINKISTLIREQLGRMGLEVLGNDNVCSPAVITFRFPERISSEKAGDILEDKGFLLSYRSEYLLKRNLMQIALMGVFRESDINEMLSCLGGIVKSYQLANLSL